MQQNNAQSSSREVSEAAIRHVIARRIQEGFRSKSGALFASAFAPIHDFVSVNGTLTPDWTREANAQVHQELFEGSRKGALGNDLSQIEPPHYEVRNLRFLTPEIAVVHISGKVNGQAQVMASAVFQQEDGEWLIVAFHNAPALPKPVGENSSK